MTARNDCSNREGILLQCAPSPFEVLADSDNYCQSISSSRLLRNGS